MADKARGMTVRFDDTQMSGLLSYEGYKRYVSAMADPAVDLGYVREWRKLCDRSMTLSVDDDVTWALQDGFSAAYQFARDVSEVGVATSSVAMWLGLRDAVIGVSRLSVYPAYAGGGDLSVDDVVRVVASLVDICARAADDDIRMTATPAATERENLQRMSRIYADIICGRAGAWLSYIDILGREAAFIEGVSWDDERDAYANLRIQRYCQALIDNVDGVSSFSEAGALMGNHVVTLAMLYDRIQCEMFSTAFPHGRERDMHLLSSAMYPAVVDLARESLAPAMAAGRDMVGYGKLFHYGTIGVVANLPREMETQARHSYEVVAAQFADVLANVDKSVS